MNDKGNRDGIKFRFWSRFPAIVRRNSGPERLGGLR